VTLDDLAARKDNDGFNVFYVSFGDLMVILCVFFVMLLTMSKLDIGSFEKVRSVMTGSTENTLVELESELRELIEGTPGVPGATVRLAEDGVRVDLDAGILFATGSAVIKGDALESLQPLFDMIEATQYSIDIEGHTDDGPYFRIDEGEIDSNWSLSGKRAGNVIVHLRSQRFAADRLRAVGYAHTRPIVPVTGLSGAALEEARARNRRVSLLIH